MNTDRIDRDFAHHHRISIDEATAYRRGHEARVRNSQLIVSNVMSRFDSWYAAGFHDADIDAGHSIIADKMEALRA